MIEEIFIKKGNSMQTGKLLLWLDKKT
jgi:hypothetical protein